MGWDERDADKSDMRRLVLSSIKVLLEITLNRSSHLQMSSVAFPVGSRASPCSSLLPGASFPSLTPRCSWYSPQRKRTAHCPCPHDGHLEKIHSQTTNTTTVTKARLEIHMIHEAGTVSSPAMAILLFLTTRVFALCLWPSSTSSCISF